MQPSEGRWPVLVEAPLPPALAQPPLGGLHVPAWPPALPRRPCACAWAPPSGPPGSGLQAAPEPLRTLLPGTPGAGGAGGSMAAMLRTSCTSWAEAPRQLYLRPRARAAQRTQ